MEAWHRLVHDNLTVLRQGLAVVESLDAAEFRREVPQVASTGIGSHVRHAVDYWRCLLRDRGAGSVDYDARERDVAIETDPAAAAAALRALVGEVRSLADEDAVAPLVIRMDSVGADGAVPRSASTLGREVHALLSHTIHHFAIVAMLLRLGGHPVPEGFGVAPSTLRYWKESRRSASVDS